MNWIKDNHAKRVVSFRPRTDDESSNWQKCPNCSAVTAKDELPNRQWVLSCCGHHMRIGRNERFAITFDGGEYERLPMPKCADDPLSFADIKPYQERLAQARQKTGEEDAFSAAVGRIDGAMCVVGVLDFFFMGGSMGCAVGESFVAAVRVAVERGLPFVVFTGSGGARMQESVLSLMQMVRTTAALHELRAKSLPYITVLCDPTTGGVLASFGMLGDFALGEPVALLAFSGARVIQGTTSEKLPKGFQRSEYLRDHGMIDLVVERTRLKETIKNIVSVCA